MVEILRAVASRCEELDRSGYQATVRLVAGGFAVSVSRNFHTARHRVTFEDMGLPSRNVLLECLNACAARCPKLSFEPA